MRDHHLADISKAIEAGTGPVALPAIAFTKTLMRALDARHGRRQVERAAKVDRVTVWRWRTGRFAIAADSFLTLLTNLEGPPL